MYLKIVFFGRSLAASCEERAAALSGAHRTKVRRQRAKRALGLLLAGSLAFSLGACSRTAYKTSDFDTSETSDAHASFTDSADNIPFYNNRTPGLMKAHFDGNSAASSPAYARGVIHVNVPDGYDGMAGAAFYFPKGTFTGSSPSQKANLDILRWDNERTKAPNYDQGGIRISGSDHLARLVRQQGTNAATTIGSAFRLQEGCWNWVWIHERLSTNNTPPTSGEPAPINDVLVNGEKVISAPSVPNNFARGADDLKVGLVGIDPQAQAGTPLDFYVADPSVGNNEYTPPRSSVCQPASGELPYNSFDSQDLNDHMSVGVNLASGNLLVKAQDLQIAGTGIDLGIDRYYNSQLLSGGTFAGPLSPLGPHWTTDAGNDVRLTWTSDYPPLCEGCGDQEPMIFHGPSGYVATFTPSGRTSDLKTFYFRPPSGLNATLVEDNSAKTFAMTFNRTGVTYHFGGDGRLTSIIDQNGNKLTYNNGTQLDSITDTQGRQVNFAYTNGKLTSATDVAGNRTLNYAYGGDNLTSYTDANNKTTNYNYFTDGRLKQIVDPRQNQTNITYDDPNQPDRVKSIERKSAATGESHLTSYAYGSGSPCSGNQTNTVLTDANNHQTTYCSEDPGQVVQVQQTAGGQTIMRQVGYSPNSDPINYTTPGGGGGSFSYDATHQNNEGLVTNRLLNAGVVTKVGDSGQDLSTGATYNDNAIVPPTSKNPDYPHYYPDSVKDEQGNTTQFGYDANGNVTRVYDQIDPIGITLPRDPTTGNVVSSKDGDGATTTYGYDPKGNLTSVTPPPGSGLSAEMFTPDAVSRVHVYTDGKLQQRTYTYDNLDRMQLIQYSDNSSTSYGYDANGNPTSRTDTSAGGSQSTTTYKYDGFNRLIEEDMPASNGRINKYGYDGVDNLTQTLDDDAEWILYRYDEANRLISIEEPNGSCTATPTTHCTTFQYNPNSDRTQTKYPNNVTIATGYDDADRVRSIKATGPAGTIEDRTYEYLVQAKCGGGGAGTLALLGSTVNNLDGSKLIYCYDARNRLSGVYDGGGSTLAQYGYDKANNLIQELDNYRNRNVTYVVKPGNELQSSTDQVGNTTTAYTYDANGNLQSESVGGSQTFGLGYNVKDQTTAVTPSGGPTTSLGYFGANQFDFASEGSVKLTNTILGLSIRDDGTGNPSYYLRDNQGNLIADRGTHGTPVYYYLFDGQGSIVGMTDDNGQLVRSYKYDPFGRLLSNTGTGPTDYMRYAGGYQTAGGLYHFGMRFYDPASKRWTQPDPIASLADLGQNRYSYANQDPINVSDLTGMAGAPPLAGLCRDDPKFFRQNKAKCRAAIKKASGSGFSLKGCIIGAVAINLGPGAPLPWQVAVKTGVGCVAGGAAYHK